MGYEYTIDKIINPDDLKLVKDAEQIFKDTGTAYASLAKKMAKEIKVNPSDLKSMGEKQLEYKKILEELYNEQNKLSEQQKAYGALLKSVSSNIKNNAEAIRAEAEANRQNKAAELDAAKAKTETMKQEKLLNQAKKQTKVTIEEAIVIMKQEIKTERDAIEQSRLLRNAKKDVDHTTEEGRKLIMQMNAVIDRNTETCRRNADAMVKQKMTIGDYKEQVKAAIISIQNGSRSMNSFGIIAKGFGGILRTSVSSGLDEVRIGIGSMIKGMVGAQAVIGGIQRLFGFIKTGVQSIINFEAANSKLAAVLGTTSRNIKDLISDAQRLGATTRYTAAEATNLQIELAKLGFSKSEILQSTEGILKFAQATGAELPEAAALAGAALRMFDASTRETDRYVSAMAVATAKSALSFSYLQTAMPIVGPVAKAFNFQIEDTLALLGKLSDSGFDASMAATATRNILLNLADGNGKLAQALGEPVKTLPDLVAGLKKLKDQGIDLNSTLELTDKRSVAAFNAFLTSADKIVPLREQITGATGELDAMADEMANNVQGSVFGLSSAWEAFMLSFYESKGPMKDVLDFFAKGLREVSKQLRSYSQLQDDADNAAVARAQKEMSTSTILQKNRDNMARLYKEKLNEGMHADEAAKAAKEEYLEGLKSQLDSENIQYNQSIRNREQAEKNLEKYGSLFGFGADKALKDDIKKYTTIAAGQKAIASITESVIEDLNKVDLKAEKLTGKFKPTLTDKEKAAAEKAARERLKIEDNYRQSELALMDEGLEKELAKISAGYVKRMAEIRGQSKEEIATRKNLAEEMKREIDAKTESYNLDREKTDIANRVEAAKKGSEEELNLKLQQLELNREAEINEAEKTGQDVFAIDEKYKAKRNELLEKFISNKNKKIEEGYAVQSMISSQSMEKELSALGKEYTTGKIKKEKYEEEKLKIQEKYAIAAAKLAVESARLQYNNSIGLSDEDKLALQKKLAEAQIALARMVSDAEVAEAERSDNARKKTLENWMDGLAMVGDALNGFADLGSAIYERRISEVEEEQKINEDAGNAEKERIEKLEQSGAISKEDAEARKRAASDRTAAKDAELAKKKAELQTKQAKMDKANAIVQSIINTAIAVMKVWGQTGIGGFALAPLVAAMGAIQLATIIAQPIPKYAKGTDNHPGGPAIVGDGGKEEMIIAGGRTWVTPSVPTLVDIPKGAVVLPDVMDLESIRRLRSDVMLLHNESGNGSPITVNVNNDYKSLEQKFDKLGYSFDKMTKFQRRAMSQADLRSIGNRL